MKFLKVAAALVVFSTPAFAGPQYVDETGFAVSGYDVVAYFDLEQSQVGTAQPEGIPGRSDITAEYNGATFAFATEANRDAFTADPARYAPQFDGHCAYGVSKGGKVPANPNLWRIVDGKLYLNITKNVVGFWEEDIPGNITLASGNWSNGLDDDGASTNTIPQFSSAAPVSN
ncbi:MAG: YHS domain-containing (seleno)protein [Pseudomonadota bacterium]